MARNLRTTARVPQLLMFSLTMPMAMLVLFSQVFRSVADGPDFPAGVSYIDFITPAMLAVATVMAGTNVGVAAAIDHTNGLHDRFRTLAMPRALPGIARTHQRDGVHDCPRRAPVGAAALLGFRFHGDAIDIVARIGRADDVGGCDECPVRQDRRPPAPPDVVQFAGMMVMMPFMFVSSAFAPLDTMPGWMQASQPPTRSITPPMPCAAPSWGRPRRATFCRPCLPQPRCGRSWRRFPRGADEGTTSPTRSIVCE